jgi:hypothetical protein
VDFDRPAPGGPGAKLAVFGGVDWGRVWCWWPAKPGLDATNRATFCKAGVASRSFAFSPGPKTLVRLSLVSTAAGQVTISDDSGQRVTAVLAPGQTVTVTTRWRKPSASVKVSAPAGAGMGITALTYR